MEFALKKCQHRHGQISLPEVATLLNLFSSFDEILSKKIAATTIFSKLSIHIKVQVERSTTFI